MNANNLSKQMQERLDKWRENILRPASVAKLTPAQTSRRGGKSDFGDVMNVQEWEEEVKKSQNRR